MTVGPLYLSAIGYVTGAPIPIEEVTGDPQVIENLDTLRDQGIEHCLVSRSTPMVLAAQSCRPASLAGSAATSAVVYCTNSPSVVTPTDDLWDFMRRAGIPDRLALVAGGGGSGNLGPGLAVARGLLATGELGEVLLVTTDRVVNSTRYVDNGLTVLSDSAASCRISVDPPDSGFRITGMATMVRAATKHPGQGLAAARSLIAAIGELVPRAFQHSSAPPVASRFLLTGNYGTTPRLLLAMGAGLDPEAHHAPRVGEIGHCFSADILIGLADLAADEVLQHGDQLMLIASSPMAWSVLAVDHYHPP